MAETHLGRNIALLIDVFIHSQRLQAQSDLIKLWAESARAEFRKQYKTEAVLHVLADISRTNDILKQYETLSSAEMLDDFLYIIWELSKTTGDFEQFSSTTMDREELTKFAEVQVSIFNQTRAMNPSFSTWNEHPFLTDDYFLMASKLPKHTTMVEMFNRLPSAERERLLLEDALYAFMGVEGDYVYLREGIDGCPTFELLEGIDPVPHSDRILKLGSYFVQVSKYIDTHTAFEYGRVNHALCAAMNSLIKDYLIFVTQLEQKCRQGNFSLQQLVLFIQPSLQIMTTLRDIAREATASRAHGGALLNLLHHRALRTAGDAKTQELFKFLLEAASEPYLEMLKSWVYKGVVKDPYNEFLIEDRRHVVRDAVSASRIYEDKYVVREPNVATFLLKVKNKILTTGKYLNVIRECGIEMNGAHWVREFKYSENEHTYIEQVNEALRHASELVLDLLRKNYKLMGRLQSMKRYFLLDQADFMSYFMDTAMSELVKPVGTVTDDTLQSLFELSLRMSSSKDDPFWEDIVCGSSQWSITTMLMMAAENKDAPFDQNPNHLAFEYFTLDYDAGWPLQLIFDSKAITKYQCLFRTLFYFKHVERVLGASWFSQQAIKKYFVGGNGVGLYGGGGSGSGGAPSPSGDGNASEGGLAVLHLMSALRSRMLHFVRTFQYYMMVDVIEPNFAKLMTEIETATTMERLVDAHENFLDATLAQCLLRCSGPLTEAVKLVLKLMARIVMFTNYVDSVLAPLDLATVMSSKASAASSGAAAAKKAGKAQAKQDEETARNARLKVAINAVNMIMTGKKDRLMGISTIFDDEIRALLNIVGNQTVGSMDTVDMSRLNNFLSRLDANEYYFKSRAASQ